ncbi:unnamed protein product, partial [Mesorhabditis belari]|uniref:Pepsin inhibitor-3-like repeated domain-containing protein n=1 Tax=Mesorhabditis belari TaxID=2138241 RepID=A0AAF3EN56_9BILA
MLFLFLWLTVTAEHIINEFSSRYGYIGPACAVEDGQLFLHGVLVRNLSDTEADEFKKYQHLLQTFKRLSENRQIADAPVIPPFCGGVDDSTEIVLKDCIVRNLHVYVGETLLRPLNNKERQKVSTNIPVFHQPTGENISDLIHRYLKINSSITARFLPVVGQSAIFSPLNEWDPIAKKPISAPNSSEMFSFTKVTNSPTPIPPDTTKATNLTTSEYLKTLIPSRPTRSRSIAETTTSLEPIRRFGHFARKPPTRWDLMNASAQLSQYAKARKETKSEETVNDPTILSIIASFKS